MWGNEMWGNGEGTHRGRGGAKAREERDDGKRQVMTGKCERWSASDETEWPENHMKQYSSRTWPGLPIHCQRRPGWIIVFGSRRMPRFASSTTIRAMFRVSCERIMGCGSQRHHERIHIPDVNVANEHHGGSTAERKEHSARTGYLQITRPRMTQRAHSVAPVRAM